MQNNQLLGIIKKVINILLLVLMAQSAMAQFVDYTAGLLHCPSGEMHKNGTFVITNQFLNKQAIPNSAWDYSTFGYGFSITFFSRLELAYGCTIFNGKWSPRAQSPSGTYRQKIMKNQDRHFVARVQALKECDFGLKWIPSIVIGVSDPTTGAAQGTWGTDYMQSDVSGDGNGYFNRWFIAATKHFETPWGLVGGTLGYQYNRRTDYHLNAPCAALTWDPKWLNVEDCFLSSFRVVAEFDSRTFNIGFTSSIWKDHFEVMFELKNMRWVSAGIRYKVVLQGID